MVKCLTNPADIVFDEDLEKELAAYAKAMGHPARIRLLKILANTECLGSDLVDQLDLVQSTVSEHLRVLKQAGLVHAEVRHPRTCFSIKPEAVERMNILLGYFS